MTQSAVTSADQTRQILVIGHSHMHALTAVTPDDPRFAFISCWDKRDGVIVEKPLSEFEKLRGRQHAGVVFMVGGSRHVTLGLVRRQPSLDFFLPEKPGLPIDADAMLLPAA